MTDNFDITAVKEKKLNELLETLLDYSYVPDLSVLGGAPGVIIPLAIAADYFENEAAVDKVTALLIDSFDTLEHLPQRPTLSGGIIGFSFAVNFLLRNDLLDLDVADTLKSINSTLENNVVSKAKLSAVNLDYLHGFVGLLKYLLLTSETTVWADSAIDIIRKQAIPFEDGSLSWKYTNTLTGEVTYNLGLSHGLASMISVLSDFYRRGIMRDKTGDLLKRSIHFMMNNKNESPIRKCFFPNVLPLDHEVGRSYEATYQPSRLAWCYGDLGINYTLMKAAESIDDNELYREAIEMLKVAAERKMEDKETAIFDAGLCHGTAGAAYIFGKLFKKTSLPVFQQTSDYWHRTTLQMDNHDDGLAGYKKKQLDKWYNDYGFLEGISGVYLSLFDSCYDQGKYDHFHWDDILLL